MEGAPFGGRVMTIDRLSEIWCKTMHRSAMWPIHGRYICPKCLREHAVTWDEPVPYGPPGQTQNGHEMSISSTTAAATR
jgi:hypothetical protein